MNMPQENQILRCYFCLEFQVHLVKKQKKWQCKICNIKQSVKQVYGKGSGKDCRLHVIKLKQLQFSGQISDDYDAKDENESVVQNCELATETFTVNDIKKKSKWSQYVNKATQVSDEEIEMNFKVMENEFCNKEKKLNKDFGYSRNEISFELSENHEYESDMETETENNKKHEKEFKTHGIIFYDDCSVKSGSKWSTFVEREQCLSDEECKREIEAILFNKTELHQNRPKASLDQESFNAEKSSERNEESPQCNTYLVNTHFEENPVLTANEKEMTGYLSILDTIDDEDDLDEILNIDLE